jgi:hypothetical protein
LRKCGTARSSAQTSESAVENLYSQRLFVFLPTERKFNMTENQTDGAVSAGGQEGSPNPTSSPQTPKPFDGDVNSLFSSLQGTLDERFTSIEKNLSERLGRVQGTVDRSQNEFRQWLGKVEQYEKQGLSREEAIAEIESDTVAEQRWKSLESKLDDLATKFASVGTQANGGQGVAKVFEAVGLDVKDPRVASSLLKQYKDADAVELEAYRLQRQIQQNPNPNPAQNPSLSGGSSVSTNIDALSAEYDELSKNPGANFERLTQIQQELDKIK